MRLREKPPETGSRRVPTGSSGYGALMIVTSCDSVQTAAGTATPSAAVPRAAPRTVPAAAATSSTASAFVALQDRADEKHELDIYAHGRIGWNIFFQQ